MTPEELIDQTLDAELEQLEEETAGQVRDAVQQALAAGVTAAALAAAAAVVVELVRAAVRLALRLGAGIAESAARAARRARRSPRRGRGRTAVRVPARLAREVPVEREVRRAVEAAAGELERARGEQERRAVADWAVRRLEGVATTAVNQAASVGVDEAARQLGADGVMWIAERNSCLACTALSGHIMPLGRRFPQGVTFGDKPLRWAKFAGRPPRHPFCRCRAVPAWGNAQGASTALQREARRSVVRGFSLPSESQAARLRAADRLLRRGAGLPRSVEAYGRDAVRAGRFPRGRTVPTGRATP